jgi:hypothetical protein
MTTVRDLLDEALTRHWSFLEQRTPPGAAMLFLNRRQRKLLLEHAASVEGLVTSSRQVAAVVAGALVGVDATGVPQYITTTGDGYAVSLDPSGVPYIDTALDPIALDPFGLTGSTPGFPLPASFVKAVAATLLFQNGDRGPLTIVREGDRLDSPQGRDAAAFVNGNRLVPIRHTINGAAVTSDLWSDVAAVALSYIAAQTFAALTDVVTLPDTLVEALVAGLAEQMALAAKPQHVSLGEKAMFTATRVESEKALRLAGDRILGDLVDDTILFRP